MESTKQGRSRRRYKTKQLKVKYEQVQIADLESRLEGIFDMLFNKALRLQNNPKALDK